MVFKSKFLVLSRKVKLFILLISLFSSIASAQKKKTSPKPITKVESVKIVSFEVLENGDTINKLDQNNIQHGRWVIDHEARYDEPGSMEVGNFENGVRVGNWRTYTLKGQIETNENYKKGLKDGEARYYEEGQLICVGHYLALNAKQAYDTVMVEDAVTSELKAIKIKTDVGSIRHGVWTFYDPRTKKINRVVEYQADEVVYDKTYTNLTKADSTYFLTRAKSFPHISKKSDDNIWFGNRKNTSIKYTDIPDNKPVKPNVRRK